MKERTSWKVGELARLTGVSVRTLHHYDAVGLLCPSRRSDAGYRLYEREDIVRLGQIKSLRHMGFSLEEVRDCLSRADFSPQQIVHLHLAKVKEQIELQQKLAARLEAVEAQMKHRKTVSTQEFIRITEAITMTEKYFTPEQKAELDERAKTIGQERIKEVEAEWPRLMAEVREAMERGNAPTSETSQALARRWNGLVEEFTGGNPDILGSLNTMYQNESNVAGMDVDANARDVGIYRAGG